MRGSLVVAWRRSCRAIVGYPVSMLTRARRVQVGGLYHHSTMWWTVKVEEVVDGEPCQEQMERSVDATKEEWWEW